MTGTLFHLTVPPPARTQESGIPTTLLKRQRAGMLGCLPFIFLLSLWASGPVSSLV